MRGVDLAALRGLAEAAARRGGDVVRASVAGGLPVPDIERKGRGDFVSAVDRESEASILEVLAESGLPVQAEESSPGLVADGPRWVVDPVDGTTNFLRGLPEVAVSVALVDAEGPLVACVQAPLLGPGHTWAAARGRGAVEVDGGRTLRLGEGPAADGALVATGFPFRRRENLARYRPVLDGVLETCEDVRRAGAAALDLAWVAAGAYDGFFELGLGAWDIAAGVLLVTEAGGVVSDWSGAPGMPASGDILAGSARVHAHLRGLVVAAGA